MGSSPGRGTKKEKNMTEFKKNVTESSVELGPLSSVIADYRGDKDGFQMLCNALDQYMKTRLDPEDVHWKRQDLLESLIELTGSRSYVMSKEFAKAIIDECERLEALILEKKRKF
jgi:hypothetical protein